MPEGIPYASSNVVAGHSKELNYVGKRCYAYNLVPITGSEDTMLEFKTGKSIIEAMIQIGAGTATNNPTTFKLYINGLEVNGLYVDGTTEFPSTNGAIPFIVILPPLTNVKVTQNRLSGSDTPSHSATFVGKLL